MADATGPAPIGERGEQAVPDEDVEPRHAGAGPVALVVLVGAVLAVPYGVAGPNFILDDWFWLRNVHFDGVLGVSDAGNAMARPVGWLVYVAGFGVLGRHPLAIYLVQTALNIVVATVLFVLCRRFLTPSRALCVALAWLVLPNHSSLDAWASTLNIVVALLLLLLGCLVLTGEPTWRSTGGVALLLTASVLAYEATLPAAFLGVAVVPLAVGRRLRLQELLAPWVALVAAVGWILAHWSPVKSDQGWSDVSHVIPAHFGWGVVGSSAVAPALSIVALAAITLSAARFGLPSFRASRTEADLLVLVGVAVIVVGTVPFLRYFYSPLGAGDRVNIVAAVGAAITWTGIGLLLWQVRPRVAVVAGVALAANMVVVGIQRDALYARAGRDVLVTMELLDERVPSPDGPIAIGPVPLVEGNIVGLLDASNVDGALQLHRGTRAVSGFVTFDVESFLRHPSHLRFDQWAALRGHPPAP